MKKIILMTLVTLLIGTGCSAEKTITFEAQIESLQGQSMNVTTSSDEVGFDQASVGLSKAQIEGDLTEGKRVKITIKPEIRETYPVQVTAVKVEVEGGIYQKISAPKAKEMMASNNNCVILDVRTLEEYKEGHIEGALLLPHHEVEAKAEDTLPDKVAPILVYCRSGNRSSQAAKELIRKGYTAVYDLGGIMDWPYPVVKE